MTTSPVVEQLSTRTLVRGTVATFDVLFTEADGTPLVPGDPSQYPSVTVTDTEGIVVETGVATSTGSGRWQYQFQIPADGIVSTNESPWRIDWFMLTAAGRSSEISQNFAVVDVLELTPNDRAYTILVKLGESERLMVKYRQPQDELRLVLTDSNGCGVDMSSTVVSTTYGGWYVYYCDTPPWTNVGHYLITWTTRQNLVAPTQTIVQQLRVPEPEFWFWQSSVRMLIDKVQKKAGHVQSYSDSDIYEYLLRGVDIVNGYTPVSHWNLSMALGVSPLVTYVVAAAAVWGLQAQMISETDLSFSFSGQTTTLDQDKTSGYSAAIDALNNFIQQGLPTVKKGLAYQSFVGVSAIRPYSMRNGPFVAKIAGSGNLNEAIIPIGRLGILI